jgi:coenzyme F420-0:L-glutamate ligase/coenzyme F420-1:gamma-L-glutamate ligase
VIACDAKLEVTAVPGLPLVGRGDDVASLAIAALDRARIDVRDDDILVFTSKILSRSEGRFVDLTTVTPSVQARVLARETHKDPRLVELILRESIAVSRKTRGALVVRHRLGFVCANAGIDLSNVERGWAALLPLDSDRSARRIRDGLRAHAGVEVGVIISDTFGRPWRDGLTDVAIGCAGVAAVVDLRGTEDSLGRELQVTKVCVADEIASAAELVMGKSSGVPVAIVRGVDPTWLRESSVAAEVIRSPADDLFR